MKFVFKLSRALLILYAYKKKVEFEKSLANPLLIQEKLLKQILHLSKKEKLPEHPTDFSNYSENENWTREKIVHRELTSGSSGLKKAIQYNRSLFASFENMFLIWAYDILKTVNLNSGRIFISFSPQLKNLGIQSDEDYLSPFLKFILNPFLSVKPRKFQALHGQEFIEKIATELCSDKELEIISVWSPTYFLSILDCLQKLKINGSAEKRIWKEVWPNLKLISCWSDGSSGSSFEHLQAEFPDVQFQGKGLLATEAPMTIPWKAAGEGCLPIWTETYLEYIDSENSVRHLSKIKKGQVVELLISTKGGLLRYKIGDLVECTGFYLNSPILKFLRRSGEVSDLVGEKIDAFQLQKIFNNRDFGYWTLVPNKDRYSFITDKKIDPNEVEKNLNQIFHYFLARELNQLKAVEIYYVPDMRNKYFQYCETQGIKRGDIKDRCLWKHTEFLDFVRAH